MVVFGVRCGVRSEGLGSVHSVDVASWLRWRGHVDGNRAGEDGCLFFGFADEVLHELQIASDG